MSRARRRLAALAATLAVGASFAAAAPIVHAQPNDTGTPTGCKITGKDSNGATFTDTYAEGSEVTVTTPNGGTTKFKCVNGSWVQQARVRNTHVATVVVSHAQLARMIG